jgi:small subunit ribosomal protein S8
MILNDLISDMLTRIRNGYNIKTPHIKIINSIICKKILDVLYEEGYIRGYKEINKNTLELLLKYCEDKSVIKKIERISKPGKRVYYSINQLTLKNNELYVLSTPKGIMSSRKAIKEMTGGEVIFKIV